MNESKKVEPTKQAFQEDPGKPQRHNAVRAAVFALRLLARLSIYLTAG